MNKKVLGAVAGLAVGAMLPVATVSAWGPERPTYTNEAPADHAVFNSITNNAAVGDERDFVRIGESVEGAVAGNDLKLEVGKEYEVWIYYHNDASATYNDAAHNYIGVARNTRMATSFPAQLAKGEQGAVNGKITWDMADLAENEDYITEVWDEAYVTAEEAMTLHYVDGSAKIYNSRGVDGAVMPITLFSNTGTFLGVDELNGVVLGCDEYSGQVVYTIQTEAVDVPATGVTEVPKELPKTGPVEVTLAVVLVMAIVAGMVYWSKTRHAVSKATRRAKGKK